MLKYVINVFFWNCKVFFGFFKLMFVGCLIFYWFFLVIFWEYEDFYIYVFWVVFLFIWYCKVIDDMCGGLNLIVDVVCCCENRGWIVVKIYVGRMLKLILIFF